MLYIVWIWWPFRSEEVAAVLPLGTEPCLAYKPTAALLWCGTDAALTLWGQGRSQCLSTEVCFALSLALHMHLLRGKSFWKVHISCFASLFHTPIYSLGSLIWPAFTELCCKVWASCVVWSLGQREEFLHFRREYRPSKPASQANCLPFPERAARKWKYNPVSYGSIFLYWRVETEWC